MTGGRIVILGANGQVASEVTLILKKLGSDAVPVCRGAMGASFLRWMGVATRIGSIGDADEAERLVGDADLIAIFALAGGTPGEMRRANDRIIAHSLRFSQPDVPVLFFSTLSVNRGYNAERKGSSAYGREKLRNERYAARLAASLKRDVLILRLGHVYGELQNITHVVRNAIRRGAVRIPQAERRANAVHTATIVDAILGVLDGRLPRHGRYDLVNEPQWSWRDVLRYEAEQIDAPLVIAETGDAPGASPASLGSIGRSMARAIYGMPFIKNNADPLLRLLSASANEKILMNYRTAKVASELAALQTRQECSVEAALYPGMETRNPAGLRPTMELLEDSGYAVPVGPLDKPWPADVESRRPGADI